MTQLCDLFNKYGADKCPQIFHSYSPSYFETLHPIKEKVLNVLEVGIGTYEIMSPIVGSRYEIGASLKAWRDFFPNAKIYGLDINKNVLINENRIECFYTDQSSVSELEKTISDIKKKNNTENLLFDLIIDDGSHLVNHMISTFNTLKKYLNDGGLYIIEDIKLKELSIFEKLNSNEYPIIKTHKGNSEWDSFIILQKKY